MTASSAGAQLSGAFGWLDWAVVALFFALTSWIGERFRGRQATIRDFFLGGRKLPWYAVAASIVATEISAVTLISLPSVVFRPGGDLTYLQLGLVGSLIARGVIALVLVPAYYEREIYSPYDYMGHHLGEGARRTASALFALGGVLAQSARVYLTALVLQVILREPLAWLEAKTGVPGLVSAVAAIGAVAVAWTLIGGIATVIWTDAVLFLVFLVAVTTVLVTAVARLDGGFGEMLAAGREAGKLRLFDFDFAWGRAYTFWAALFAASWGNVAAYGTDQLLAQRILCCKGVREARKAVLASYAAMVVTVLVALSGIALYAWSRAHPLAGEARALFEEDPERILPIFLLQEIPAGLKGLIVAGIFAAAISSLDSILAALSQSTLSALWLPLRARAGGGRTRVASDEDEQRRTLRASRFLVVIFGLLLCALAVQADLVRRHYASILDLALALAGYTQGALLAGFLLAFWRVRVDASGFAWAAPLSVLAVFAAARPAETAIFGWAASGVLCAWTLLRVVPDLRRTARVRAHTASQTVLLAAVLAALYWANERGVAIWTGGGPLAFPWFVPLGSLVAFALSIALARPREAAQ